MTTYRVPHTFIPGTKANASQVNENFSAVMSKIEDTKQSSANLDLSNLTTAGKKAIYDNSARSKLIGEIITSAVPLTDSGLHLLDGSLLSGGGVYSGFVQYVAGLAADNPSLFVEEEDWQQSVTSYGVCGKFVYDSSANTVRLPKITGFIEGTTDTTALGELIEAGLPNIEGDYATNSSFATSNGAFANTKEGSWANGSSGGSAIHVYLDASLSNAVYGNAETVQPQAIKVLYYIVVATTAKTDIETNIDNVTTDLNGKADKDLGNCTKPYITETYSSGTSWYRVYSDGWIEQGGEFSGSYGEVTLLKPFQTSNYRPQLTYVTTNSGLQSNKCRVPLVYSVTNSDFVFKYADYGSASISKTIWEAKGY